MREASERHLGGIIEKGDIWKASGRHLGSMWEAAGDSRRLPDAPGSSGRLEEAPGSLGSKK